MTLIVLVLTGLAVIFGSIVLVTRSRNKKAASWTTTKGRVVSSAMVRVRDIDGQWENQAQVVYEYVAGGQTYRGSRVKFGFTPQAKPTVTRYPAGCEVDVHYDPAKPQESVLER